MFPFVWCPDFQRVHVALDKGSPAVLQVTHPRSLFPFFTSCVTLLQNTLFLMHVFRFIDSPISLTKGVAEVEGKHFKIVGI